MAAIYNVDLSNIVINFLPNFGDQLGIGTTYLSYPKASRYYSKANNRVLTFLQAAKIIVLPLSRIVKVLRLKFVHSEYLTT